MLIADVGTLIQPSHVLVAPQVAKAWRTIVVRPGDTVWALAIAHHTTVQAIIAKNRLVAGGSVIHLGQRLLVPGPPASAKPRGAATPAPARRPDSGLAYVVRAGETMTGIAARHAISLTKLLAANRLPNPGMIHVGQRIALPGSPMASRPKTTGKPPATSANTFAGWTYSDATVAAAKKNRAALAATDVPSRTQTAAMIRRTATRHGVDPKLALAIAWQESGWNQRSVSVANAIGTMQVIPMSGRWASDLAGRRLNLLDTQDNITAGVLILRELQARADSRKQAIAGYYQGLHSVRTRGLYADTLAYVAAVLAHYARM